MSYARKFYGGRTKVELLVACLTSMTEKLISRGLCSKVYVSPHSNASEKLQDRDENRNEEIMDQLERASGTLKTLLEEFKIDHSLTRLVVLDFGGLSSDFGDIQLFFLGSSLTL